MTDKSTLPTALRLSSLLEMSPEIGVDPETALGAAKELRRQHARIAELEADLEAVGAGGVQALSAAPVVPAGWKLVPAEPTQEMLEAPSNAWPADAKVTWAAMLAASPTPPGSEAKERGHG